MRLVTFGHDRTRFTTPWLPALDSEQTLVLAFASPEQGSDPEPFRALRDAYPHAHLIGCATAGRSLGTHGGDEPIAVAVARLESTWLRSASVEIEGSAASHAAGVALARQLVAPRLRGVLVLAGGCDVRADELARGLREALPTVAASGFLSCGDGGRGSWVLQQGAPVTGRASAIGFYGDDCRFEPGANRTLISETSAPAALALVGRDAAADALPDGALSITLDVAATFAVPPSNLVASLAGSTP